MDLGQLSVADRVCVMRTVQQALSVTRQEYVRVNQPQVEINVMRARRITSILLNLGVGKQ